MGQRGSLEGNKKYIGLTKNENKHNRICGMQLKLC